MTKHFKYILLLPIPENYSKYGHTRSTKQLLNKSTKGSTQQEVDKIMKYFQAPWPINETGDYQQIANLSEIFMYSLL